MDCRTLKAQQRQWAERRRLSPDPRGYVRDLVENLFRPLSDATRDDFRRGSGGELSSGRRGQPPKMHALHSSSALACNVFDYWRSNGMGFIREALEIPAAIDRMEFEAQFPTGLPGKPPNLDLALFLDGGEIWAVESKFTEPFCSRKKAAPFKSKYFPGGQPIWAARGLPRSAQLAQAINGPSPLFEHLDAAQLLKHALGLHARCGANFVLLYVYIDPGGPLAAAHSEEIQRFAGAIRPEWHFFCLSYSELLTRLRAIAGPYHDGYFEYLTSRYPVTVAA